MTISELSVGQSNVNVEGTIIEVGEIRSFDKYGRELKVANTILKDDTGNIKLTLWNEDCTKFKEGDKIKIVNGYVNEFQGEKQLTSGKFGKIEKVDGEANEEDSEEDSEEETKVEESEEEPKEDSEEDSSNDKEDSEEDSSNDKEDSEEGSYL